MGKKRKKSVCDLCGKEFNFPSVPHMHVKSCEKKHSGLDATPIAPSAQVDAVLIDPYVKKGQKKAKPESIEACKAKIIANLSGYFDASSMSRNERAMVHKMLAESSEVVGNALKVLLSNHGIKWVK